MVELSALLGLCDKWLEPHNFQDYAPNGLQIFGQNQVKKVITGVSANMALIEAAIAANADTIIVHHGFFWRGENPCLTGLKGARIGQLLRHRINLIGYHLPLDAHLKIGNNAILAQDLNLGAFEVIGTGSAKNLLFISELSVPISPDELKSRIEKNLARTPLHIASGKNKIAKVAWCTGAAQDFIDQAAAAGADAYLSGEISERTTHEAQEYGIDYFAIGHHASERGGVRALGALLAQHLDIEQQFIDIANPV